MKFVVYKRKPMAIEYPYVFFCLCLDRSRAEIVAKALVEYQTLIKEFESGQDFPLNTYG